MQEEQKDQRTDPLDSSREDEEGAGHGVTAPTPIAPKQDEVTPSGSESLTQYGDPPAAPSPTSINLHPPPSPRQRVLQLDEPAERPPSSLPQPSDSLGIQSTGSEGFVTDDHPDDGHIGFDRVTSSEAGTNVGFESAASAADDQISSELSSRSSLFVHLGAQAPEDRRLDNAGEHEIPELAYADSRSQLLPSALDIPPAPLPGDRVATKPYGLLSKGVSSDEEQFGNRGEREAVNGSSDSLLLPDSLPEVDSGDELSQSLSDSSVASTDQQELARELPNGEILTSLGQADAQQPLQHQNLGSQSSDYPGAVHEQNQAQPRGMDSQTLAEQIRNMTQSGLNRPKARQYAFPAHADADTLQREVDEFYSYVEAPQVLENKAAWEDWWNKEQQSQGESEMNRRVESSAWTSLPTSARRRHVTKLLALLTSRDPDQRLMSSRAFLYILQGNFADTHGSEHQEHWIKLNAKMCRSEGAIAKAYEALKKALWKHDFLCSLPDHIQGSGNSDARPDESVGGDAGPLLTPHSKAEYMEEVNLELTLGFAQLYLLIETGRRDEEEGGNVMVEGVEHSVSRLSEDLMSLQPPMPVYLFTVLAGLREKNARGFPVKKLLLCLWKSLLACLGGQKDIERCKQVTRKVEGLPPNPTSGLPSNAQWPSPPPKHAPTNMSHQATERRSDPLQGPDALSRGAGRVPAPPLGESRSGIQASSSLRLELGTPRSRIPTKASPNDFESFREELAVKFPTYIPPRRGPTDLPIEKLATAVDPLPPRRLAIRSQGGENSEGGASQQGPAQPSTPAPSPPPSPRPGKQKFQTDQTKPFVLPFSSSVQGDRTVPYSIEEADRLYKQNMYVSTEAWQLWRTKEDMAREERGLALPPGNRTAMRHSIANDYQSSKGSNASLPASSAPSRTNSHDARGWAGLRALSRLEARNPAGQESPLRPAFHPTGTPSFSPGSASPRFNGMSLGDGESETASRTPIDIDHPFTAKGEPTYDRLVEVEEQIHETVHRAESDHLLAVMDNDQYSQNLQVLHQQLADVRRLQRVDMIYKGILDSMQSGVIVLLKLLLATVTAQGNNPQGPSDDGMDSLPPPTVEDIDILRHREITTKAISAILLLLLKWFGTSHALKFHHLNQFLVDSNCMLLILKMFGLQEVANSVRTVNEVANYNFFNYCNQEGKSGPDNRGLAGNAGSMAQEQGADENSGDPFGNGVSNGIQAEGAGGSASPHESWSSSELMTDYSFRNFFSVLNFTRILQKMTKRRVHRILLLTQYKSSAIFKRLLKVPHPVLQLYILKIIKSQVPFCGRKWRQANMRAITGIYLNCRPDLRDEWLSSDVEDIVLESLPQEQALRALVKFYVRSRFGEEQQRQQESHAGDPLQPTQEQQHRLGRTGGVAHNRSLSGAEVATELDSSALTSGAENGRNGDDVNTDEDSPSKYDFFESEFLLPPLPRSRALYGPGAAAYIPDDVVEGYLGEYEEILSEVFGPTDEGSASTAMQPQPFDRSLGGPAPASPKSPVNAPEAGPGTTPSSLPASPLALRQQNDGTEVSPSHAHANAAWSSNEWGLTQNGARSAWNALGEILGDGQAGDGANSRDISDTESIASIGELDFSHPNNAAGAAAQQSSSQEGGVHTTAAGNEIDGTPSNATAEEGTSAWENLSPKEMRFLASQPRSPTPGSPSPGLPGLHRRASSSSVTFGNKHVGLGNARRASTDLRPVLNFDDEDLQTFGEVEEEGEAGDNEPVSQPQAGGIDEVEHVFGE